ncbi:hypothetical protein HDU96_003736 [Phlyctochytrium bullatum]|nr:hypothetical protein HDU96_003736 [Phlyctochytrium bullatum]
MISPVKLSVLAATLAVLGQSFATPLHLRQAESDPAPTATAGAPSPLVTVGGTSASYDFCGKLRGLGNARCVEAFKDKPYNLNGPNSGDCITKSAAYADDCIKAVDQKKVFTYSFVYPAASTESPGVPPPSVGPPPIATPSVGPPPIATPSVGPPPIATPTPRPNPTVSAPSPIVTVGGTSPDYEFCGKLRSLGNSRCIEAFKGKPYDPNGPTSGDCITKSAAYADECIKAIDQKKLFTYNFAYPAVSTTSPTFVAPTATATSSGNPQIDAAVKRLGCTNVDIYLKCASNLATEIKTLGESCLSELESFRTSGKTLVPNCACDAATRFQGCLKYICRPENLKMECAIRTLSLTPAATVTEKAPKASSTAKAPAVTGTPTAPNSTLSLKPAASRTTEAPDAPDSPDSPDSPDAPEETADVPDSASPTDTADPDDERRRRRWGVIDDTEEREFIRPQKSLFDQMMQSLPKDIQDKLRRLPGGTERWGVIDDMDDDIEERLDIDSGDSNLDAFLVKFP